MTYCVQSGADELFDESKLKTNGFYGGDQKN